MTGCFHALGRVGLATGSDSRDTQGHRMAFGWLSASWIRSCAKQLPPQVGRPSLQLVAPSCPRASLDTWSRITGYRFCHNPACREAQLGNRQPERETRKRFPDRLCR